MCEKCVKSVLGEDAGDESTFDRIPVGDGVAMTNAKDGVGRAQAESLTKTVDAILDLATKMIEAAIGPDYVVLPMMGTIMGPRAADGRIGIGIVRLEVGVANKAEAIASLAKDDDDSLEKLLKVAVGDKVH